MSTEQRLRAAAKANRETPYAEEVAGCEDLMDEAADEIERLTEAIEQAAGKLSCVAIERGCSGVPEIVRVCDEQALGILLAAQGGRVS
jgi:hypothetical protein